MKTFRQFLEEAKAPKPDALETIQRKTKGRTPGMKYVVHTTSSDDIRVDNIEVPENQRGKGIAKRTFKGLHNYADKIGKNVSLTPVAKPGYKEKLDKMYRNLGYRDRTPSDKIAGADTMIREPKKEEFEYELEESSTGERSGRRTRGKVTLARGRGADMTRDERTTASVAKKAGLKGTGKYSTKDLRSKTKEYSTDDSYGVGTKGSTKQDTIITTHSSPRQAAEREGIINKSKSRFTSSGYKTEIKPSSDSVRRVKDLRKQITKAGASKRGQVHSVDILPRDMGVSKGDKKKQIERGKNFIQALKDTPEHLKKAGAKKGESVIGKPTAVMPDEDKKTGEEKRAKLYRKIFKGKSTKKSNTTGYVSGKVDESYELEESSTGERSGRRTRGKVTL